jgi:FeS assembly SUF system protein
MRYLSVAYLANGVEPIEENRYDEAIAKSTMSISHKDSMKQTEAYMYPLSKTMHDQLRVDVIAALETVYDPEIPLNIYKLGLIYEINIDLSGYVLIKMTLTSMSCPFAHTLPGLVEKAVNCVPGVVESQVELVWDPPWTLSEAVRLELNLI